MIKILDFYADWCKPCTIMAPILLDIESELDYVTLEKINIEENTELTDEYGVRNIPTLLFFKDDKQIDKIIGAIGKEKLKTLLAKHHNTA